MSGLSLLVAELRLRWISALLVIGSVVLGCVGVQFFRALTLGVEDSTRKIQRDIGLNVLVLPPGTDLAAYWETGIPDRTMPEDWMRPLEDQGVANRLIPVLKARVEVTSLGDSAGEAVVAELLGVSNEVFKDGKAMKPVFGVDIPRGHVRIGSLIAERTRVQEGGSIGFLGRELVVERILAAGGNAEDARVYGRLEEVQGWLGLEGRIHEIQALECHCGEEVVDPLAELQGTLGPLLPGALVLRRRDAADARRNQRLIALRTARLGTPVVATLGMLAVAILAALNLRERGIELALLRSLGWSRGAVGQLVLARSSALGGMGALLSIPIAIPLIDHFVPRVLGGPSSAAADGLAIRLMLVGACALAAGVAGAVPAAWAATQDPARSL